VVHLGLKRDVAQDDLLELVRSQDIESMLDLLHTREVGPGDTVFVPPGTLHAIGAGTLLAEVQEPEDLSILLDWRDFELDGEADGHLGLGFPTAIGAARLEAWSDEVVSTMIKSAGSDTRLLPDAAAQFFRLDKVVVTDTERMPAGFAVLIVIAGNVLVHSDGADLELPSGSTVVVPFAAGELTVTGSGEILLFRPPE
jgi:mannose-6-phosphate isomerase